MRFLNSTLVLLAVCLLTALTQIGGMLFLITHLIFRKSRRKQLIGFSIIYLIATFLIVPFIAPHFGRERIKTNKLVKVHMFLTTLSNRNYVVPEINTVLDDVSRTLGRSYQDIEIHCLDANFPFWDGFPLVPHLSHNDGKKLDISLIYKDKNNQIVNQKPSRSGYGIFESPKSGEYDQIEVCKDKGYWQYDFPKYLTLGSMYSDLKMSENATKELLLALLTERSISKIFIEPHLRTRMSLKHPKLRYHGCRAVRHDDHIHIQVF